jgi:hypothetical protein
MRPDRKDVITATAVALAAVLILAIDIVHKQSSAVADTDVTTTGTAGRPGAAVDPNAPQSPRTQ